MALRARRAAGTPFPARVLAALLAANGVFLMLAFWMIGASLDPPGAPGIGAVLLTVLTYALCTGLCAVSQTWWHLMIFRFVAGSGGGPTTTQVGVPSFVITLAGLLGFQGLLLYVLGKDGTINIPDDSGLVQFARYSFVKGPVAYALVLVGIVLLVINYVVQHGLTRVTANVAAPVITCSTVE